MFDVLNVVYLGAILLSNIMLAPEGETLVPVEKDAYVQLSMTREWWREDGSRTCAFKGVMVPYTRTWPEEVQRGGDTVILPPEPDKIAGYVAVVNRKVCKDKEPEAILRAGLPITRKEFFKERMVNKTSAFPAGDMLDTPADKIPPWLPQVIERLELLAQKDAVAKNFLDASANELNKVLPSRAAPSPAAAEAPAIVEATSQSSN